MNSTPEAIFQVLRARYAAVDFAFLYGSARLGTALPSSDIDCIAVSSEDCKPFRETFAVEGKVFDVYLFDAASLLAAMRASYREGNPVLVESVLSALILGTASAAAMQLVGAAAKLRTEAMRPTRLGVETLRYTVTGLIDDLSASLTALERTMLLTELCTSICDLHVCALGEGLRTPRHAARILKRKAPAIAEQLNRAFHDALTGDHSNLLAIGLSSLALIGGPLRAGYRVRLPELGRQQEEA